MGFVVCVASGKLCICAYVHFIWLFSYEILFLLKNSENKPPKDRNMRTGFVRVLFRRIERGWKSLRFVTRLILLLWDLTI